MEEENDNNKMMIILTSSKEGAVDPAFVLQPPFFSETIITDPTITISQNNDTVVPSPDLETIEPGPSQPNIGDPAQNDHDKDKILIDITEQKSIGRDRPMNTSPKQITPKISKKQEKNYDAMELIELRKRRKLELHKLRQKRHREKKKKEREANKAEILRLQKINKQLKQKEREMLEEISVWTLHILSHSEGCTEAVLKRLKTLKSSILAITSVP